MLHLLNAQRKFDAMLNVIVEIIAKVQCLKAAEEHIEYAQKTLDLWKKWNLINNYLIMKNNINTPNTRAAKALMRN